VEWHGRGGNIRNWLWPKDQLREKVMFQGDEPWCVLFREAAQYMVGIK
jgi:hypothetical protein